MNLQHQISNTRTRASTIRYGATEIAAATATADRDVEGMQAERAREERELATLNGGLRDLLARVEERKAAIHDKTATIQNIDARIRARRAESDAVCEAIFDAVSPPESGSTALQGIRLTESVLRQRPATRERARMLGAVDAIKANNCKAFGLYLRRRLQARGCSSARRAEETPKGTYRTWHYACPLIVIHEVAMDYLRTPRIAAAPSPATRR